MESTGTSDDAAAEATDTTPTFNKAKDKFGNALTETTFTNGDFGTIYRSFKFNEDSNTDPYIDNSGNNLVEEADARGNKTSYTVNGDTSRNEEVTDRLGNKTAYEYDDSGRTTKVTSKIYEIETAENKNPTVSYAYDTFDNMTEIVRGDGMKYALAYNEFHNLESIGIDGKAETLIQYTYKNGNGRLKEMKYANGDTMKATYNSIGQMVAETWFDKNGVETARYKYVYDGDGNIARSIDITSRKEYNYEYEEGRLVRATEADIELSGEIVTSKIVVTLYDNEDSVCGILYNTVPYYFIKNMQGDIIAIVDKDAQTVARYSYDAWGVCTVTQDSVGIANVTPFRYRGYYYDEEIGLYYLRSRYFDPRIDRFISSDEATCIGTTKMIVDCNIYAYCYNTPVNAVDYSGNLAFLTCLIVGAIAGAVIGASYAAYKGYIGGKTGWELAWHILKGGAIGAVAGAALGAAVYGVYYAAMAIGAKLTAGSCGTLGKVVYSSWQKAEQALRNAYKGISKTFNTPYGKRIVDSFSKKAAREAKYGYQGLSKFIQNEINKDAWLLKNGYVKSVEWHFYVSQITSKGGPSAPLLKELLRHGFKVIYH